MAVRQGPQEWGDRVVIDLNQPAPWQVNENRGEAVVTVDAKLPPELVRSLMVKPGKQLQSLKLETSGNQTILRFSYPNNLRPRIWSLNNPNRLLIDLRPDWLVERNILWAPGVRWQQRWVKTSSGQFPVVKLEIDPRQPGVSVRPILSSASGNVGTAPLFSTIQRLGGIAAINAGFFNRNNELPLGAIRSDNRWLSGPILNRGAIAWNDSGDVTVGHLNLQENLTTANGQSLPLQSTNSGYVGAGVARYTPDWGRTYTNIINGETLLSVRNGQITEQRLSTKAGQTTVPIPNDGYLLVVRANQDLLNTLAVGTKVQVNSLTQPDEFNRYAQVLGAGPLLVQNGRIVLNPQSEQFSTNFIQEAAPRSVIATTPQGKLLLLTVLNRAGGAGPTLAEAAQVVQQLGVVNALNLDGGSSATLYLGGQVLNRAVSTTAPVHNGIGVFIQPNS
jgi:exopolysaccharide biosynthesis protein